MRLCSDGISPGLHVLNDQSMYLQNETPYQLLLAQSRVS